MQNAVADREFVFTKHDFERVRKMIYARAGIALADSKENLVYSRLARRLREKGLQNFSDYLDWLEEADDSEWQAFTNSLTTNLTSFFREEHHFHTLIEHLRKKASGGVINIWCSASSTGEEPYSIAMTACEAFNSLTPPVRILATDIDTQVLNTAQRAVYPEERVKSLAEHRLRKFVLRGRGANQGQVRVKDFLRDLITFQQLNLLSSSWSLRGPFTVIFCRNVLIYFDKPTQKRIVERFAPLLETDGLLFLGHSENVSYAGAPFKPCGRTTYVLASGK